MSLSEKENDVKKRMRFAIWHDVDYPNSYRERITAALRVAREGYVALEDAFALVSENEQSLLNDYTDANMQNDLRRAVDRLLANRRALLAHAKAGKERQ